MKELDDLANVKGRGNPALFCHYRVYKFRGSPQSTDFSFEPKALLYWSYIRGFYQFCGRKWSQAASAVMQINSQTESLYYYTQRQPDTNFFRSWEIAGASHAPVRTMQLIRQKTDRDGLTDSINTYSAIRSSEVNWIYTVDAAFQHINVWINGGDPPPQMQPMELSSTKTSYMNDQYGNAKGGIRLPELEVPIARYIAGPTIALGGYTIPFTEAQLKELYPTHEAYVQKVEAAAIAAKDAGVILPYRVEEYVKAAEAAPIPTSIMPNLK